MSGESRGDALHPEALDLRELIVFLVAAGFIVPVAHRFHISPVLGFLLTGLLIGPFGAGRLDDTVPWLGIVSIDDDAGVHLLAELGVVLLLFVIGLELSVARLWSMRRMVFGLGGAQVAISAAVIGATAYAFGNSAEASLVLGSCLALSSTAIVMHLLTEGRRLGSAVGQASFSVLLLQDLAVVPILFLVGMLGADTQGSVAWAFGRAIVEAIAAIIVIGALGLVLVRPIFGIVGATKSRELFMATVLLTVIGTAVATAAAGLSMALGAFLAGLLLADTEYRHQVEVDIEPFKGLLLGVFFLSVGMGIDPLVVVESPVPILTGVLGLIGLKAAILFALARAFRLPAPVSLETALLLGAGGEFAFVVIGLSTTRDVIPEETGHYMMLVTGLSMMLTPVIARYARDLANRLRGRDLLRLASEAEPVSAAGLDRHVLIAGYGRVGQMLGALLDGQSIPHVALDTDVRLVASFRRGGGAVYVGDASRPEIMERVGIDRAVALVVTMDSITASERVVEAVRKRRPHLPIFARARDAAHAARLMERGATKVVPETIEASLQLGEAVLAGAGLPEDAAHQVVAAVRAQEGAKYTKAG
ncbi:cation:proton antiporter [Chthonobacter albigriseus]|uniref:cation:proton antiporter domain-containing protein n=1 Tax=Chthonobacter albigriseus TaxID=1683161 RepID=UPI0015EEEFFC|nr:cation:proton antiporter [Chthonobacter albigriseus]